MFQGNVFDNKVNQTFFGLFNNINKNSNSNINNDYMNSTNYEGYNMDNGYGLNVNPINPIFNQISNLNKLSKPMPIQTKNINSNNNLSNTNNYNSNFNNNISPKNNYNFEMGNLSNYNNYNYSNNHLTNPFNDNQFLYNMNIDAYNNNSLGNEPIGDFLETNQKTNVRPLAPITSVKVPKKIFAKIQSGDDDNYIYNNHDNNRNNQKIKRNPIFASKIEDDDDNKEKEKPKLKKNEFHKDHVRSIKNNKIVFVHGKPKAKDKEESKADNVKINDNDLLNELIREDDIIDEDLDLNPFNESHINIIPHSVKSGEENEDSENGHGK